MLYSFRMVPSRQFPYSPLLLPSIGSNFPENPRSISSSFFGTISILFLILSNAGIC